MVLLRRAHNCRYFVHFDLLLLRLLVVSHDLKGHRHLYQVHSATLLGSEQPRAHYSSVSIVVLLHLAHYVHIILAREAAREHTAALLGTIGVICQDSLLTPRHLLSHAKHK